MLKYFLIILALFISFSSYENLKADEGEEIFSGVISQIDADSDGKLEAVHILLNDGTTKRFEVSSGEPILKDLMSFNKASFTSDQIDLAT